MAGQKAKSERARNFRRFEEKLSKIPGLKSVGRGQTAPSKHQKGVVLDKEIEGGIILAVCDGRSFSQRYTVLLERIASEETGELLPVSAEQKKAFFEEVAKITF